MALPNRKAQRLKDFDYSSAGAYFITICVKEYRRILSAISYSQTARRDSPCGCPRVAEVGDPYGIFVSRSLSQKFSISICKKSVCRFGLHTLFAILFLRFLRHYGQSINLP